VSCDGGPIPFSYLPVQFLTLTLPVEDILVKRSYTISSSPTRGYYCEISVKREQHGVGSRYLHDVLQEGNTIEVRGPSGRLTFTGKEADSIVLIGGGVGITPLMSVTRALADMSWKGEIILVISCSEDTFPPCVAFC
jgi:ferredoxin-NADP reductase